MNAHTKGYKAFMKKGFRNWSFLDHQISAIHKDYEGLLWIDEANVNIDEQFQGQLSLEKEENHQMLFTILLNVQYLGRQGLTFLRNSEERNFDQLKQLSAKTDPRVWKRLER